MILLFLEFQHVVCSFSPWTCYYCYEWKPCCESPGLPLLYVASTNWMQNPSLKPPRTAPSKMGLLRKSYGYRFIWFVGRGVIGNSHSSFLVPPIYNSSIQRDTFLPRQISQSEKVPRCEVSLKHALRDRICPLHCPQA